MSVNALKCTHCSSCGTPYADPSGWPRTCAACGDTAYGNPLPVAVALLPVRDEHGTGLVVVTRAIAPARGKIALPGGFVDHAEDWRDAVVRELREETEIEAAAEEVRLVDALSDPGGYLLLFGLLPPRDAAELPSARPTKETYGREVLHAPLPLAFPLHTKVARRWFGGAYAALAEATN